MEDKSSDSTPVDEYDRQHGTAGEGEEARVGNRLSEAGNKEPPQPAPFKSTTSK